MLVIDKIGINNQCHSSAGSHMKYQSIVLIVLTQHNLHYIHKSLRAKENRESLAFKNDAYRTFFVRFVDI